MAGINWDIKDFMGAMYEQGNAATFPVLMALWAHSENFTLPLPSAGEVCRITGYSMVPVLKAISWLEQGGHLSEATRPESRIYFLRGGGLIKIGVSKDVVGRLHVLQSMSPVPIELIGTMAGNKALERLLHKRFATSREHGEWFLPTGNIMIYIEDNCNDWANG